MTKKTVKYWEKAILIFSYFCELTDNIKKNENTDKQNGKEDKSDFQFVLEQSSLKKTHRRRQELVLLIFGLSFDSFQKNLLEITKISFVGLSWDS